jgi:membrane protease YdiL (CAAX protease family)
LAKRPNYLSDLRLHRLRCPGSPLVLPLAGTGHLLVDGYSRRFFGDWFRNPWIAIILTSIIFSAIHMSYYGFLARAMLGVVLGLIYYYGKSIWLNILAHFLNNAVAVTYLYISSLKGKLTKDALEDHFPIWLCLLGMVLLAAFLHQFKKKSESFLADKELLTA